MPNIEFKDLSRQSSIGTELFADAESFLEDLTDDAENILGGISVDVPLMATTVSRIEQYQHPPSSSMATIVLPRHPGGNSGINCTGLYTTGITFHKPRHPRPINHQFATGANDSID